MVERWGVDYDFPVVGIAQAQAGLCFNAADPGHGHAGLLCGGDDGGSLFPRRGKAQLVIVAAGQRLAALQCLRLMRQHGTERQRVNLQCRPDMRCVKNVLQVAAQAVGNIDGRMGNAAQVQAQRDARCWRMHARGGLRQLVLPKYNFLAVAGQREARIAEGAGNPDVVANLCVGAPQG